MIDMVMQYAVAAGDKRPSLDQVMTNELIGDITLSKAEWDAANAKAAPFKEYLS